MFSPGSLATLNPFIYRRQLELFFETEECKKPKRTVIVVRIRLKLESIFPKIKSTPILSTTDWLSEVKESSSLVLRWLIDLKR